MTEAISFRALKGLTLAAAATLGLVHCGPPASSCNITIMAGGTTSMGCADVTGLAPDQENAWRMQCTMPGAFGGMGSGTASDGLCTHANSVGGCRQMFNTAGVSFTQTVWFYARTGVTREFVQSSCPRLNAEFVAP